MAWLLSDPAYYVVMAGLVAFMVAIASLTGRMLILDWKNQPDQVEVVE